MGGRVSLPEFIERFRDEPRLRQRVGALTGASVFFAGGLIVAGFGQVVLVAVALAAVGGALAMSPSLSPDVLQRVFGARRSERAWQLLSALVTRAVRSAKGMGVFAPRRTRAIATKAAAPDRRPEDVSETQAGAEAISPPTAEELYGWPYVGSDDDALAPLRAEQRADEELREVFRAEHSRYPPEAGRPAGGSRTRATSRGARDLPIA